VKVESGGGITEIEYDACACSPVGKVKRVSRPYAAGGAVRWTVYGHDALGRTTSVLAADGASTARYEYLGNTVKAIDPAGKWKRYTRDAFGNLVRWRSRTRTPRARCM
jgi:YD repeat-containing protein